MVRALITGATAGIGNAFAKELAAQGTDLTLVARNHDRLEIIAADLSEVHRIEVEVLPTDLSVCDDVMRVAQRLESETEPVDMLVNNAGLGLHVSLIDASQIELHERAVGVMYLAMLILGGAAGWAMKARGRGRITNVAPTSGAIFTGSYSAIKVWTRTWSTSLALEFSGIGVTVTTLLPGWVRTEPHQRAGISATSLPSFAWIDADNLVKQCLRNVEKGYIESVPTKRWKASLFIADHGPREFIRWFSRKPSASRGKRRDMTKVLKPGKHASKLNASTRQAAQMLLLKPAVWRLLRVHVHGKANLEGLEAPCVVFVNHSSYLDTPLIYGALSNRISKYLAVGAARDHFYNKWWKTGPMSLFFNGYPIDRGKDKESKKRSVEGISAALLSAGVPLLIYPEGSRSRTGAVASFKPGMAALCISRQIPAVPIVLIGVHAAWPSSQKHLPKRRPMVHVVIGRPLRPQPGETAHEFNERIRRQVLELHDTAARACGTKTLDEYVRAAVLEKAARTEITALAGDARTHADQQNHQEDQ